MYAGKVAEEGPVARVFSAPRHPYTQKLLGAFPNIHADRRTLDTIPGLAARTSSTRRRAAGSTRAARSRWTSAARSCRPRSPSPTASGSPATSTRRARRGVAGDVGRGRPVAPRRAVVHGDADVEPAVGRRATGRTAMTELLRLEGLEVHFPIRGGLLDSSLVARRGVSGPSTGST